MSSQTDAATTDQADETATEAAAGDQTDQSVDQASDQTGDGDQPDANPNAEAAKYRVRARDAEAERDRLAERLTALQRADAERQAGQRLGKGADLWAGGVELSSLLDDEGNLSPELLDQAVTDVIDAHPHWKRFGAPPASAVTANDRIEGSQGTTFTDAFRPPDKR